MKFTFIEKKMAPSDSLRAYAEKKVSKIDRLFRTESEANVTFSTERGRFTAEITIKNNGTFFRDDRAPDPQEQDPPGQKAARGRV